MRKTERLGYLHWQVCNLRQWWKLWGWYLPSLYQCGVLSPIHPVDREGWQASMKTDHLFVLELHDVLGCE
jgi:hypothetical protein